VAKAKWYVEVDTYYEHSRSVFFGPYATKEAAIAAVEHEDGPCWSRHRTSDVRYGTRAELHNTTSARRAGMREDRNLISAQAELPGTTEALRELESLYLYLVI